MNTRTMSPFVAVGFDWSVVTNNPFFTLLTGGGAATAFMAWLNHRQKRQDDDISAARDDRRQDKADNATVAIARLDAETKARAELFATYQKLNQESRDASHALRGEMQELQSRMEMRLQHLEDKYDFAKDAYNRLFAVANNLAMQCRLLRGRLMKIDKDFDVAEYPDIPEVASFSPQNVFVVHNPSVSVPVPPGGSVKTSFLPGTRGATTRIDVRDDQDQ